MTDAELDKPWDDLPGPYHWTTYVGERVREIWSTLPIDVRRAIAEDADEMLKSDSRWDR